MLDRTARGRIVRPAAEVWQHTARRATKRSSWVVLLGRRILGMDLAQGLFQIIEVFHGQAAGGRRI